MIMIVDTNKIKNMGSVELNSLFQKIHDTGVQHGVASRSFNVFDGQKLENFIEFAKIYEKELEGHIKEADERLYKNLDGAHASGFKEAWTQMGYYSYTPLNNPEFQEILKKRLDVIHLGEGYQFDLIQLILDAADDFRVKCEEVKVNVETPGT